MKRPYGVDVRSASSIKPSSIAMGSWPSIRSLVTDITPQVSSSGSDLAQLTPIPVTIVVIIVVFADVHGQKSRRPAVGLRKYLFVKSFHPTTLVQPHMSWCLPHFRDCAYRGRSRPPTAQRGVRNGDPRTQAQ